jgi:glycosyltransferase involved in cell wall biosynthesis
VKAFDEGYDIISMVRTANKDAGFIKNVTSSGFYSVINSMSGTKLEKNASDFFGISGRAAEVLRKDYREKVRFLRGYVQGIGFRKTSIEYQAANRVAGKSHYSIKKLFRFSMDTIMCFSDLPLRLGIYAGSFSALLGLILLIYTIATKVRNGAPSGYATTIVVICFMFAMLFLIVGIIGEYIGILFKEVKGRPIYIVEETLNFDRPAETAEKREN